MIPSLATRGATATFSAVKIPPADVMEDLLVVAHQRGSLTGEPIKATRPP